MKLNDKLYFYLYSYSLGNCRFQQTNEMKEKQRHQTGCSQIEILLYIAINRSIACYQVNIVFDT